MKRFLFLLLWLFPTGVWAQETVPESDSGYVLFHADSRIELLLGKPARSRIRPSKVRGYRVQIYNGNDRQKAAQIKMEFMRMFPGNRAYIVYNNPQFRVRVGDFTNRKDAADLYRRVSSRFSPSMVVPDIINTGSVKKKQDND